MKHPAAAAGVLALHLLGLLALATARAPTAAAPDSALAQRNATLAVLQVALHSAAAPAPRPALAQTSPALPGTTLTTPAPAATKTPVPGPTPKPATNTATDTAANAAAHAAANAAADATRAVPPPTAAPTVAVASAAPPSPQPQPSPPTSPVAGAAPAPEPPLTLAHADRRDCPPATHPAALRERGIEGEVRLLVRVGTDGRAAEVRLQQTSGWRLFDHAALAQAQACRFVPARRGLQAVEDWVEFPVRFSLRG